MVSLDSIRAARERAAPFVLRSPMVPLRHDGPDDIWLKLENLQPFSCFKMRAAASLFGSLSDSEIAGGVITASAGNWAQAVAFMAKERGVPCTVVVPETSPENKRRTVAALGAEIEVAPFADWWDAIVTHQWRDRDLRFVHPVEEEPVMAGNGVVGLEILEDLPEVDAVLVPFGGGGLSIGIASALRGLGSGAPVHPVETTASPKLARAVEHGKPTWIDTAPSFVDGIGGNTVLDPMWDRLQGILAAPLLATADEIAEAIRVVVSRARVVPEGAGACPVAVALAGRVPGGRDRPRKIVCVVSGGNIEMKVLRRILDGETPDSAR